MGALFSSDSSVSSSWFSGAKASLGIGGLGLGGMASSGWNMEIPGEDVGLVGGKGMKN